jgi:hypothetical protein
MTVIETVPSLLITEGTIFAISGTTAKNVLFYAMPNSTNGITYYEKRKA